MSVLYEYGDEQNGEYMGIGWKTLRCYDSSPTLPVWGGYVCVGAMWTNDGDVPDKYVDCMRATERECTYNSIGTIGFECEHGHDFPYILSIIKNIIRAIIRMVDAKPEYGPKAINDFLIRRNAARDGAVAVMLALRSPAAERRGTGDVAKIIARVVWSTRVFYK